MKLHLVQPMGGAGLRFAQDIGFNVPKPLIPLHGKPFFYWATASIVKRMPVHKITFIVLQQHIDEYQIDKEIHAYFPEANIAILPQQLNGPVMTCLHGLQQVKLEENETLLINDCDHMLASEELTQLVLHGEPCNALVTFHSNEPCFSYVKYEDGKFAGTVEKVVVSNNAICGAYMYKNAATFLKAAQLLLNRGLGQYAEYFMSDTYNILYSQGEEIKVLSLDVHTSFGTPAEYREVIQPLHDKEFEL